MTDYALVLIATITGALTAAAFLIIPIRERSRREIATFAADSYTRGHEAGVAEGRQIERDRSNYIDAGVTLAMTAAHEQGVIEGNKQGRTDQQADQALLEAGRTVPYNTAKGTVTIDGATTRYQQDPS